MSDPRYHFRPDDGTSVGNGLATLNALLSLPLAPLTTIRVWFGPAPAELELADEDGNPVDAPEVVVLEGKGAEAVLACSLADAMIAEHRRDAANLDEDT